MNFWINDFRGTNCWQTIREWDFLLINDSEARMLSGENNLRKAANEDSGHGSAHAGDQARRVRRHAVSPRLLFHRARLSCWKMFSIPPARAIASRAASSATWPSRASISKADHISRGDAEPRGDLRVGDGKFLLRTLRRGALPHAHARPKSMPALKSFASSHRSSSQSCCSCESHAEESV